MSPINSLRFPLSTLPSILATPLEYRLEDIQCGCLSFSPITEPTLCAYLKSYDVDWQSAYSIASNNNLKIQFTTKTTITEILSIPSPLPSEVLQVITEGEALPLDSTETLNIEDKMVCGLGNEIKHIGAPYQGLEPELHYAGAALGSLMMLLVIYLIGEYLWKRSKPPQNGTIKLLGAEKTLTATFAPTQLDHVVYTPPTDDP